jgi:hypothetical protein
MTIKQKIQKVWTNKWKILEGVWTNHIAWPFLKSYLRNEIYQRRAQCFGCPHLDRFGTGENVILKHFPACSLCGCNIKEKTACLSCHCSLKDEGKKPRWKAIKSSDRLHNIVEDYFG